MMIRWWEHGEKGVTDRQTDRRTDWTSHIAAWSQLKIVFKNSTLEITAKSPKAQQAKQEFDVVIITYVQKTNIVRRLYNVVK